MRHAFNQFNIFQCALIAHQFNLDLEKNEQKVVDS